MTQMTQMEMTMYRYGKKRNPYWSGAGQMMRAWWVRARRLSADDADDADGDEQEYK
jgi:hypothetical protein